MEISTFELLTKPLAPLDLLPPQLDPVARRIVQGYFLTISNLEDFNVRYRIEFTVSLPEPEDPNKIIILGPPDQQNVSLLIDVEGENNEVTLAQVQGQPKVYRGFFRIPAHKTASVELLPKLPNALTPGMLEVRGYVSLFRTLFPFPLRPVKVLLNPEIRGTFLPNDFLPSGDNIPVPPNTEFDFDQINYTLALASGKALNEISRKPFRSFVTNLQTLESISEELRNGTLDLDSLEADNSEKAQMLVQLLAELDASEVNLSELNTVMERLEIPVRMSSI